MANDCFMSSGPASRSMGARVKAVVVSICMVLTGCISQPPPDMDGDGIEDSLDIDMDGDGWDNSVEENCSTTHDNASSVPSDIDGDWDCDLLDEDDDGDGWSDDGEIECGTDSLDPESVPGDQDGDGVCDSLDDDADGDGLPNDWEASRGFDPMDADDYITCHGEASFCLRTYDDFTFAETHNAYSTVEDKFLIGVNHYTGLQSQWEDGIRAFMVDSHHRAYDNTTADDVSFCHGTGQFFHPCQFGIVDAFDWIRLLDSLMNNSSGDIVTLLIENYVPASHLSHLFNETGMSRRVYTHTLGDPWPSLGDLALAGTDLVVFWEQAQDHDFPWLHDFGVFSWTTDYAEDSPDEMDCTVYRGDGSQPVWHLNNWLTSSFGLPDPVRAGDVNDYETLLRRSIECWEKMDDRPTFIAVDYWEEGEVTNVTITINKMSHWSDEIPPHP
ncbi:MAG: hypothetical protein MK168_03570 [Candidatus Thalassarchaeum sp.]|nr:hypothetical protein [Candidatus Thalassarchaeum sp.]